MARDLFRKELASCKPYVPGKPVEEVKREYGLETVEKLASNENPLGPSPLAIEAMRAEISQVNFYPEPTAARLRQELGAENGIGPENVVVGNGGEHLLQLMAQTFIDHGDEAIMADPIFDPYVSTVSLMGGVAVRVPLKDYKHDLDGFLGRINEKTKIIYVCNPNNPTGSICTSRELAGFVAELPEDLVLVLDEAYYEYARENPEYPCGIDILKKRPNTLILRTFSKFAGIAGVRVAYILSSARIAGQLVKPRGTFCVNRLAQAAALGALKDKEHMARTVELNSRAMALMTEHFRRRGLAYVESSANFVFVDVGRHSMEVFESLMRKGIIIRPGAIWGWDSWLRVSTGTMDQTRLFVEKLDEVLGF